MIHALVAEAARYGRRLLWLVVPSIVLAVFALATAKTCEREWQHDEWMPYVTVRSNGPALPPPGAHDEEPETIAVRGRILDEQDRPVAGAEVFEGRNAPVLTDRDGRFELRTRARTYIWLLARKGDLTTGDVFAWRPLAENEQENTFHMRHGATIVVHAVELDGLTPIANAHIELSEFQQGVTGPDGTIAFHDIHEVQVTASAPGHGAVSVSLGGWRADGEWGQPKQGQHYWVTLPKGAPIAGTVVDPSGRPLPNAKVEISTIETPTWHRDPTPIRADENGSWQLEGLAPGTYGLTATANDFSSAVTLPVEVDGEHAVAGLVVPTVYGAQLVGTVLDSAGKPAPHASVSLRTLGGDWESKTDERGEFHFLGMPAGRYELAADKGGEASRYYRVDLVSERRLTVELATVPTIVAGIVVDSRGRAVAGANVGGVVTDTSGHFEITGVTPGNCYLSLVPAHERNAIVHKTVRTGEQAVVLVMPSSTTITGRVLLDGQPVRSFAVYINYAGERVLPDTELKQLRRVEHPDGHFAEGVYAGRRSVVIAGDSFLTKELVLEIPDSHTFDLGDVNVDSRPLHSEHP